MRAHRQDAKAAPFRSGTDEEVTEATILLEDLAELEDDEVREDSAAVQQALAADLVKDSAKSSILPAAAATAKKRSGLLPCTMI